MTDYASLIERLEKADAGSGELSEAVGVALDVWWIDPSANADGVRFGPWTQSLDAALSLVERKLPGWAKGFRDSAVWAPHHKWAGKPVCEAIVADPGDSDSYEPWGDIGDWADDDVQEFEAKHCTPALAVCLALLRALSEQARSIKAKV